MRSNFTHDAFSVFGIYRCIGLHPYDGKCNFSKSSASASLAFLVILSAFLTSLPIILAVKFLNGDNVKEYAVWTVLDFTRCATCSLILLTHWQQVSLFRVRDFSALMEQVRAADSRSFFKIYIFWLLSVLIYRLVVRLAMMAFKNFTAYHVANNLMEILVNSTSAASALIILQICAFCRSVNRKLLSISDEQITFGGIAKFLRTVEKAKKLSQVYGPQMIFIFFFYFVESTNALYYTVNYLEYARENGKIQILFTSRNLLTLNFVGVASLTLFRHISTIERTSESHRKKIFLLTREHAVLCKNKRMGLFLTQWTKFHFSAFGFFSVGYPLMTTMVSVAVTYMFVALQVSV